MYGASRPFLLTCTRVRPMNALSLWSSPLAADPSNSSTNGSVWTRFSLANGSTARSWRPSRNSTTARATAARTVGLELFRRFFIDDANSNDDTQHSSASSTGPHDASPRAMRGITHSQIHQTSTREENPEAKPIPETPAYTLRGVRDGGL